MDVRKGEDQHAHGCEEHLDPNQAALLSVLDAHTSGWMDGWMDLSFVVGLVFPKVEDVCGPDKQV